MSSQPLVSIIIPTHNRADLLPRAIRSALAQDYPNVEIIVIDDHSTDQTEETMRKFALSAPTVRYLKLSGRKGANAARNEGIRAARGTFVCGLDDDDEFHPERIRRLIAEYDEAYAFVFSGYRDIVEDKITIRIPAKEAFSLDDILGLNLVGNQVLTTRQKILAVGGYDESLPAAQDYDLWIRMLARYGKAKCVRVPLYSVYFHSGETITGSPKKVKGYFAVYKKHKHLMTRTHRKEQLANLYLVRRKPLSPKTFRTLVTRSLFVPLTGLFLESRTPFLHRLLRWIKRALTDSVFSRQ